ncbi:alpha amylase C-terminal domain-containing protein [Reinekea sp.]|uniref:alpha amylase C-terminal domain-containing protein n=1 Tax=Reinekea sp. TaxID=1970455 RepID=UPI002A7FAE50|nr:alpha amylase C-terminal domain-containing protein [Reinekea sp.]
MRTTISVLGLAALTGTMAFAIQAPPAKDVTVHLFEWKWSDIQSECAFLESKGYGAIQVSPPNEHAVINTDTEQYPWWQRYQPVSYELSRSRSGTVGEFQQMVETCWQDHGVKVYVDAIINHMAGDSGTGSNGTPFGNLNYTLFTDGDEPVVFSKDDFHPWCEIDWKQPFVSADEIQTCWIAEGGLPDLATERDDVQDKIIRYFNSLIDMGVAGFRIDAAKHVKASELDTIYSGMHDLRSDSDWFSANRRPVVYQEVIGAGANEGVGLDEFMFTVLGQKMQVTEFSYGKRIGEKFRDDGNGPLADYLLYDFPIASSGWGLVDSAYAMVFTDNHDNQRGHGNGYWTSTDNNSIGGIVTNYYDGAVYSLANVFMLAWPYGSPKVMSSYDWPRNVIEYYDNGQLKRKDLNDWVGPPSNGGVTNDVSCGNGWICEHQWQAIAGMVGFNNYSQDAWNVGHRWHNNGNQIAFARETDAGTSRAFVVINREGSALNRTLSTGLPEGSYCDVTQGSYDFVAQSCTGATVSVDSSGFASFNVPAMTASAIHVGAPAGSLPPPPPPGCNFDTLNLRGTANQWSSSAMSCIGDNIWQIGGVVFQNGDNSGFARFKFDRFSDWTENYGDDNADKIAERSGKDIIVLDPGTYIIRFNDATLTYEMVGDIRPTETVKITFSCTNGLTQPGTSVYAVGNHLALGNWAVASINQRLEATRYPVWRDSETIVLPKNTDVKWKCVKAVEGSLAITEWQGGADNSFNTGAVDSAVSAGF